MSDEKTTDTLQTATEAPAPAGDGSGLYLVDGSGFIFRAFHALPMLNRPDGTPVNAVLGFSNMLLKLLADLKASAVAVVFDSKRLNFRNEFYPEYKAHRPEPPEELKPQFALIREATEAFCLPCLELEGYEADDLIATYARLANEAGREVTIVSSDKDMMQLVRPGVRMLDPLKNKPIGPDEVFEKFGVAPDRVVDVQALAGDSVDNVPGVPGIGVKTAAQLITEYGDLESLLARAGEIKQPARRQKLIDFAEQARISRRLVLLDDHAPPPKPLEELRVREPDHQKLIDFLRAQGFRTIVSRVEAEMRKDGTIADGAVPSATPSAGPAKTAAPSPALAAEAGAPRSRPAPPTDVEQRYELVQDLNALAVWLERARTTGVLAVDTETNSLTPATATLVGISLATEPGLACYIPLAHQAPNAAASGELSFETPEAPKQIPAEDALKALQVVLEDPAILKIGHNFKFDHQLFARHGVRVSPIDDSMLISYVLEGGAHGHGMDELAELHLAHTTIPYKEVCGTGKNQITFDRVPLDKALAYAAEDADITLRLWRVLKPRLVDERMVTVYETLERPLVPVIADMESCGIRVDRAALARLSQDLAVRMAEIEKEVHQHAGRSFNIGSPKQLGEILFDEMKLGTGKKGKTGAYSTDSSVLEELAEQGHVIAQRVLDWRQLAKLKNTYTDALQAQIVEGSERVHTAFAMAATNTGRLSSTDPNLQNIPVRTEEGRKIRRAFVAAPGHKLISIDYSQIELRLVAEMADIAALKQAFQDGIDIHAATASQVFGVPLDQMTSEIRRKAKAINFGIIYGISGFGLGRQLGIAPGEANAFIKAYFERFHELKVWMEATKAFARQNGHVVTLFGRRCYIPGIHDKNAARRAFAERQAINAPIQGTAADIMKRAMARVPGALKEAGFDEVRMLLQVHDELLFEAPEDQAERASALVRAVMEGAATLGVPLVAEAGIGGNWDEAH
ncbi:DNA polymerase I [Azospirillum brasilense]|uniref:DNA polymerase I n=1 Tax=Azospirillum brasilense TaxID=192 RepID=A0A0P0F2U8_AZOBR|nr:MULTISPECIES: DNA polymerase I [Azospirillum]ALJ39096.1 DNA polymerase I [Azospirillum brasilense]MDW7557686.1 DNA polymerase I [Azospirillum brasilense]MDW7595748.1 DNA polymerase I [Azospirillum brasilense]MDW7630753.1 DNA polymerase I [Azospirillum brasilense]MDX5950484.1 DNA polymerase I [Azospirillum brasilense]